MSDINSDLIKYSTRGELDEVIKLLDNGADVNAKDKDGGLTALMKASEWYREEVVNYLIEKGADVNAKDDYGNTALMRVTNYQYLNIFMDSDGVDNEYNDVIKTLIKNKADVNAKNNYGNTALMNASIEGHEQVVDILTANGADINARNDLGYTALMMASDRGHIDIVKTLLIEHQAKVSNEDKSKLKEMGSTFTLDLVDKRDLQNQLLNETRQIPEIQTKKKSLTMKL